MEQIEKIISALSKVYQDSPANIDIIVTEALRFKGDEGDLLEILGNLLDNAFKYGGGEIRISADQTANGSIKLCIADNGPGVTAGLSAQILQRGERADTLKSGPGIGLAIVTDIVSSYRGSLQLDRSELGGLAVTLEI